MSKIIRDPEAFSKKTYDLIIIGGGIYGVMLSFEASRRGLKALLVERADFGGGTTFNCLRILHGGFRYLQTMDLYRFRESVAERRWFLKFLPGLVTPLPCLMPLYGKGLRRPSILRLAACINDALSHQRNEGVHPQKYLPASRVISTEETKEIAPSVASRGLQGGLIWYDAFMPDSQRILMEILRLACANGGAALNYVEANEVLKSKSNVNGILATDLETGQNYEYQAPVVINAAGPWSRDLARKFDKDIPKLFKSSIAWNVLFNKPPISTHALALDSKRPDGKTYFLIPFKDKLLAGTNHAPWTESEDDPNPTPTMVREFLDDLNSAVPSLNLTQSDILHVFSGLLPAKKDGGTDLTVREVLIKHANHGGPRGLYSISGVKFTTARLVAEKALKKIFPDGEIEKTDTDEISNMSETATPKRGIFHFDWYPSIRDKTWKAELLKLVQEEAVRHLDDLIFRRTTLWENPTRTLEMAPDVCDVFDWDQFRRNKEIERLKDTFLCQSRIVDGSGITEPPVP